MLVRRFGDEKVICVSPKDAYHLLDHYLCMSEAVVHSDFLQPLALKPVFTRAGSTSTSLTPRPASLPTSRGRVQRHSSTAQQSRPDRRLPRGTPALQPLSPGNMAHRLDTWKRSISCPTQSSGSTEETSTEGGGLAGTEAGGLADMEAGGLADTEAEGLADTEAEGLADTEARGLAETEAEGLADMEAEAVYRVKRGKT